MRDKDIGPNAELSYRIARGNEYRLFHLEQTSGALTVFRSISAEFIDLPSVPRLLSPIEAFPLAKQRQLFVCDDSLAISLYS